ncbi:MAG: hypothetical protein KKH97_01715 [Proteobacteria bacterium]|nr:hypothetical protein [Pseudomonadota bacterium]
MTAPYKSYQEEQSETLSLIVCHLIKKSSRIRAELENKISDYLVFRAEAADFHSRHLGDVCTMKCYKSHLSACCSKEGVITFFADVVINVIMSDPTDIDILNAALEKQNDGFKCVYLGEKGCMWKIKPIVCEMFICDTAKKQALHGNPKLMGEWDALKKKEKIFTWPDRPVLFDEIESYFMAAGCYSPLMYMHNSPGLLRVKKMRGNVSE